MPELENGSWDPTRRIEDRPKSKTRRSNPDRGVTGPLKFPGTIPPTHEIEPSEMPPIDGCFPDSSAPPT
eukprot:CAMPEP_0175051708 /NCGR_PEP_ID=MMETSP0052_2-20121109/7958_1 /TAXON_ID=51329 ORGANISM="Polytomella parva, Strain SAG 63-3" /NCGR_SAMPLE_ID=MMETSP0052_2 /ASSEMBLY_ACC=CAM_ASM_000194 /LENGTH=68 /DNA_ID=CAMNT_0016316039 /DNA_START=236 /DNA_END=438 /DNA_ORIENTATION=-